MEEFPLHWHVWHNEVTELRKELARLEVGRTITIFGII